MINYHFKICFIRFSNGVSSLEHIVYTVTENSRARAWRNAVDYALDVYGVFFYTVELHSTSTP